MRSRSLFVLSILSVLTFSSLGGDTGLKDSKAHKVSNSSARKGGVSSGGGDPEVPDCLKAYEQLPKIEHILELIETACAHRFERTQLECIAGIFDKGYPMSKAFSDCKVHSKN